MHSTILQRIKEANESFLAGTPKPLDPVGTPFIVLACIDPRLTGLLEPALGLPRRGALVVRSAGNQISETFHDALRSIATGIYLGGGNEIFVVGHTDCTLAKFSTAAVIENFRKMGIPRSAFGDTDLRAWFGAFHDIRANIVQSVDALRKSAILPASVKVHGLLIEIEKGMIEVVVNGDLPSIQEITPTIQQGELSAPYSPPEAELAQSTLTAHPPPVPTPPQAKISQGATESAQARLGQVGVPISMMDVAMILRDFLRQERQSENFQHNLQKLSTLVKREKNPAVIFHELEKMVKEYQHAYPRLPSALAFCKKSLEAKGTRGNRFMELMRRILE